VLYLTENEPEIKNQTLADLNKGIMIGYWNRFHSLMKSGRLHRLVNKYLS